MSDAKSIVDRCLDERVFDSSDFMVTGTRRLCSVPEVREILEIHTKILLGSIERRKYYMRKISTVEDVLTASGSKKLGDAKNSIRTLLEKIQKQMDRSSIPIEKINTSGDLSEGDSCDRELECSRDFIEKMHSWGNFPETDKRYYIHMVFRFYFNDFHAHAKSKNLVLEFPSFQYVLDVIRPNGCASRFPPEFRRFLRDSEGRNIETASLPVPVRGSGNSVSYQTNFEKMQEVSLLRRKIYLTICSWKESTESKIDKIYPRSLIRSRNNIEPGNEPGNIELNCINLEILKEVNLFQRIMTAQSHVDRVGDLNPEFLQNLDAKLFDLHESFNSYPFRTSGEQLRERMGFFMRPSIRSQFFSLKTNDMIEEFFSRCDVSMDNFVAFDEYCRSSKQIQSMERRESGESICRGLLSTIQAVIFLMYVYKIRDSLSEVNMEQTRKRICALVLN